MYARACKRRQFGLDRKIAGKLAGVDVLFGEGSVR